MTALAQIIAASLALVESRPDLHGKIIRGGNFSSRARSSPMEKREAIVPRDRVCYRSNRNRFLSLSLSLFYFYFYSFSFFFFAFNPLSLHRSIPRLAHMRSLLCSTLAVRSFLRKFFFIFLPLHFAATGFHGQLISSHSFVSYSLFNSHCTFDLASSPRNRPDYRPHARWPVENCAEFLRVF